MIRRHENFIPQNNIPAYVNMYPPPIPEPPRVINTKPLVSDVSIITELSDFRSNKVKKKPSKHCIKKSSNVNNNVLKRLRRKYGIVSSDMDDTSTNTEDDDNDSVEDLSDIEQRHNFNKLVQKSVKKTLSKNKLEKCANKKEANTNHDEIQKRLELIKNNLRKQLEKLQTSSSSNENDDSTISVSSRDQSVNDSPKQIKDSTSSTTSANESSNISKCSCKQSNGVMSLSDNSSQLVDYIKRQDQQLQQISRQIEELIKYHQIKPYSTPSANNTNTCAVDKSDVISFNQRHNVEVSHTDDGKLRVEKRSIQTMTSMIADNVPPITTTIQPVDSNGRYSAYKICSPTQPKKNQLPIVNRSTKGKTAGDLSHFTTTNFLDSSVEKARRDLRKNLKVSDVETNTSTKENRNRRTASKFEVNNYHDDDDDENQLYEHIMANINSILVRNGSFESTDGSNQRVRLRRLSGSRSSSISNQSNGFRSSCSNTPTSESNFDRPKKSSPIRSRYEVRTMKQSSIVEQSELPNKLYRGHRRHVRHVLHSEQSLYVKDLASKYAVDGDELTSEDENEIFTRPRNGQVKTKQKQTLKQSGNSRPKLPDLNSEAHFDLYALSAHNTSIDTENYLKKYGLMCTPDIIGHRTSKPNRAKSKPTIDSPLLEEVEEESVNQDHERYNDSNKINRKPREPPKQKLINPKVLAREIKSRPSNNLNKILDLEAIRNLPKFT